MIIPLTCVLISTLVSRTVSSDFTLKGDPCSKFDSCLAKPQLRTCSCETDCQQYGTCCYDFKNKEQDIPSMNTYSCYSRHASTPVYAKRSCSDDFRGHIGFRQACFDDDEDEMDVKNNLLVTSHKTKITYWNKHCAKCSNEETADLAFWNIEVFCPQRKNVDRNLIRRNLTFDEDKKRWGLEVDGEFLLCVVKYAQPSYTDEAKPCSPKLISSCPANYTNEETAMTCMKYYAERKLKGADVYYKNVYCAICNGADVTDLECPGMSTPEENVEESDFREMVEVVFTDGSWLDKLGFECSKGYSYDPTRTKCRTDPILSKVDLQLPNSSSIYRTKGLTALAILFALIYSY